ncbi:MAG: FAD-dependent oxidoreductase [Pseudomonadota bacterium]
METLAADLRTMVRTPLHDTHVRAMRRVGEVRHLKAGDWLAKAGERADSFDYIEEGEVIAIDPVTGDRYGDATLGPTQFFGEVSFLTGGTLVMGARCGRDTRVLSVPREAMLDLMSAIPEMSDIVVTVFAARRRGLLESNKSGLTILGAEQDRGLRWIAAFANRNRLPVRSLELGSAEADQVAQACSIAPNEPAVIFGKSQVIEDPTPARIARLLGLDTGAEDGTTHDVVIVGGGPSGVAAGVYAGAEGLSALVLDDLAIGGQAGQSSRIENYMGFPTGISGADLCWRGEVQALKFGTRFAVPRRAVMLPRNEAGVFRIGLDGGGEVRARSVVVSTGVRYRKLPIDRIEEFEGAGVYYSATDLEARYCKDGAVLVIGGGNSAGQAAMYLRRTASHVHLLVRGPSLAASMSDYLLSRLDRDGKVTIHYNTELQAIHGDEALEAVTIRDKSGAQDWKIDACGVFVMVGAAPNTDWLSGLVELDDKGFVKTGREVGGGSSYETSMPGVFAVGDVRAGSVKRVASAVGEGSVVISKVWDFVNA